MVGVSRGDAGSAPLEAVVVARRASSRWSGLSPELLKGTGNMSIAEAGTVNFNNLNGPARFGLLLVSSAIGAFCGSEVRYFTMLASGSSGRVRSLGEHIDLLVSAPLLLPALLLTPWSALVLLATSVLAWRMTQRRMFAAVLLAAAGCSFAAYMNLLALATR